MGSGVRFLRRVTSRSCCAAFIFCLSCQKVFADLPTIESPQSGGGTGLMNQIKGYLQDSIVLGGFVLCAVMFMKVAEAMLTTFSEARDGRASWMKFGTIVVVGIVLLVAGIWLLTKSAGILV